jgi:hypothetical protein
MCNYGAVPIQARYALDLYRLHHSCTKDCTTWLRGPRWRAQVRRTDHSTLSKTFAVRADAAAWARDVEAKIDKGQAVDPGRRITFAEVATAYRNQLLASKGLGRSKAQALAVGAAAPDRTENSRVH